MNLEKNKLKDRTSHWQRIINEWQASGLSATKFCHERKLIEHRFYYWRRRFKDKPISTSAHLAQKWLPVTVRPEEIKQPTNGAIVCLPRGIKIELPSNASTEQWRNLFVALGANP